MLQVADHEEGETIGMTTNTDVKTYKSVLAFAKVFQMKFQYFSDKFL